MIRRLFERRQQRDEMNRYPGWYAAMEGRTRDLERDLGAGLDVDHADRKGYTLLGVAAFYGHVDTVRLLLAKGADPNKPDNMGNGPLWEATREASMNPLPGETPYDPEVVRLLLEAGADPWHKNRAGTSPPGWANMSPALQAIYRAAGYDGEFAL